MGNVRCRIFPSCHSDELSGIYRVSLMNLWCLRLEKSLKVRYYGPHPVSDIPGTPIPSCKKFSSRVSHVLPAENFSSEYRLCICRKSSLWWEYLLSYLPRSHSVELSGFFRA